MVPQASTPQHFGAFIPRRKYERHNRMRPRTSGGTLPLPWKPTADRTPGSPVNSTSKRSQIGPTSNLKAGGNVRLAKFGSPRMAEVIWRKVWAGWASVSGICASAGQVLKNLRLAGSHCEQTYHHSNQHHIATSVQQKLPMGGKLSLRRTCDPSSLNGSRFSAHFHIA